MNQPTENASIGRSATVAFFSTITFVLSLILFAYVMDGPTIATRSATDLAMPVGSIWISLFACIVFFALQKQWAATSMFVFMFVAIGITGNPYIGSKFIESVEMSEQPSRATAKNPYRTVAVLGGGTNTTPLHTEELYRDGERIFSAAQLWHAGLVSSIICTGSSPDGIKNQRDIGAALLESAGVPAEVIFKVPGENTSQEMASLKEFFGDPPPGFPESGEIALITSAFHMHRAMRLASTQDLNFDPLPCGYRAKRFAGFGPRAMIPNAEAADLFALAFKERLAELLGR